MVKDDGDNSAEHALQRHYNRRRRGRRVLLSHCLQQEAHGGAHDAQIGYARPGGARHVLGERPGYQRGNQRYRPGGDELQRRKHHGVPAVHIFVRGDNVQAVKESAADGEDIPDIHGKVLPQRHEAHADEAQKCRADIVSVRLFVVKSPGKKRHHNAVSGGEERIFAGRGIHQTVGLHHIRRAHARAHYDAAPHVSGVQLF